jgi:hypothetical protein
LGEGTVFNYKRYDVLEELFKSKLKRKKSKHIELIGFEYVNCEMFSRKTVTWTPNYNSIG